MPQGCDYIPLDFGLLKTAQIGSRWKFSERVVKMKISIACPSYKRPIVETKLYIPQVKVYVAPEEFEAYKKKNPKTEIIECAPGVQGNLCRVRNYIMRKEFEAGADVVLLVDDDMRGISYWEDLKRHKLRTEDIEAFLEKYSLVARDLGAKMWGLNVNTDKMMYREYNPFSMLVYIGGPFQCFLKGNECFYDERLNLKEDYDMTLQQLNRYRKVLRLNKYFYDVKQSEQVGGCATQRNYLEEERQLRLLQKKWGTKIVQEDNGSRVTSRKKKKTKLDYNPILQIPIKGI